jgi:uncharacterized protein
MNRKQLVVVAAIAAAVLAALLVGFAIARAGNDASAESLRTITVTGTGIVKAAPDVADVSLGVSASAKTAHAAQTAVDAQMSRVVARLKARGVAPADIQTSEVSLSPTFGRMGVGVVGYTATNTVDARIRDLAAAGTIVAAAAASGANEISGPSLSVSDEKLVYRHALKAAVADARARAEAIASAGGETLGGMRSASEGNEGSPSPFEAKADSAAMPFESGTLDVQANVTATFDVG